MNDLISRQAAIEFFLSKGMITAAIYADRLPSASEPEQKKGHWVDANGNKVGLDGGCPTTGVSCSECGDWLIGSYEYCTRGRFCPNCGAKMDGDVNDA